MRMFRRRLDRLEKANPKNEMPWSLERDEKGMLRNGDFTISDEEYLRRVREGGTLAFVWSDEMPR